MKNWRSDNLNQSAFEKTGPIPRSITRTFEKFKKTIKNFLPLIHIFLISSQFHLI